MQQSCFKCKHFFVTWDQHNPRGCRAYQFKSKAIPSIVVKKSSGLDCLKFEQKAGGKVQ
ncbi:uracil-DNA glycosylase [Rummeliibacillus sp. TYF005]|uniref:uracil-DNA glycosylase n=1 Tax=Rummeliibacillus sp. TYF005 TaxID=2058214 RepID=UPI000F54AF20|nr:uracil-DNA glycosylase [Rummeliibacillus sp. TYF005]RPJ95972.1 uracil-DNA glycosylase [Rummeliibacillus sp. TYF005]